MKSPRHWLRVRPRMIAAIALGLAAAGLTPSALGHLDRILIGWNAATWCYLLLAGWLMLRATPEHIRHIARLQDESALRVLVTVCIAAVMSLAAIVLELATVKGAPGGMRLLHMTLAGATLLGSWLLLPTLFAMHYAHLYYGSDARSRPLQFPDRPDTPDYWDFAYFSFTIAVAAQTADIAPLGAAARRLVLAQSILAFIFNTSILAMSINVAASLVG